MSRLVGIAVAAFAVLAAIVGGPVWAQSSADFDTSIDNNYPVNLEFNLSASSDAEIVDVSLHYSLVGRGTSALGKPEELLAGKAVSVSIEVKTNAQSSYIPVGSEFIYFWEVTLDDGTVVTSEEDAFFFLPPDQEWKTASNDIFIIYYHGDRDKTAELYLEAGTQTYNGVGKELLQANLTQLPVKVILFSNEAEMDEARFGRSETFDSATVTCGTKVTNDIVLVIPRSCGSSDPTDVLRHEITHILTEAAGESALGKLPSWLDEGTAVHGQSDPGDGYLDPFEIASQIDSLIPFAQMNTAVNDPRLTNLFYGQSWAMVEYLVQQYGEDSFADLFATIKEGNRFDTALEEVYGFDLAGFEDEFRQSFGLDSDAEPTVAPTAAPRQDTARPTAVPTEVPAQTSVVSDDDGGISLLVIIVIATAFLFVLLAVFFFLVSMMMASGRAGDGSA